MDDLTPLDARNSLLLERPDTQGHKSSFSHGSVESLNMGPMRTESPDRFVGDGGYHRAPVAPSGGPLFRPLAPTTDGDVRGSMGQPYDVGGPYDNRQPAMPSYTPYGHAYQGSYGGGGGYRGF